MKVKMKPLPILLLTLAGCAAPGSSTTIPQPVAIAFAGGDVSTIPPEAWTAPPVTLDMRWYDRSWGLQVDRDKAGEHFADLQSAASGETALAARQSDNARSVDQFSLLLSALQQGLSYGMASQGMRLPGPPSPPAAAAGDPVQVEVLEQLQRLAARLDALESDAAFVPDAPEAPAAGGVP
jgi:hypothetical protein